MAWDDVKVNGTTSEDAGDWNTLITTVKAALAGANLNPAGYGWYIYPYGTSYAAVNKETSHIDFTSTCFGTVVNTCITSCPGNTPSIELGAYSYTISAQGINMGQKSLNIIGVTPCASLTNYGTRITCISNFPGFFITGGTIGASFEHPVIANIHFDGNDSTYPAGAIHLINVSHAMIQNVFIDDFFCNTARAFWFYGEHGQSCYYNTFQNYCIRRTAYGLDFDGIVNANWIYGGHITNSRVPSGSTTWAGFYFHGCGSNHVVDVDIEDMTATAEIGVWITSGNGWHEFRGLRCEDNYRDIVMGADGDGANHFFGGSTYSTVSGYLPIVDNGAVKSIVIGRAGMENDKCGTATMASSGSAVTVTHGLYTTPAYVFVSPSSSDMVNLWVTSITATQFVIKSALDAESSRTIYWRAVK